MSKRETTTTKGRRATVDEREWETCVEPDCDNRVARFVLGDFYCKKHTPTATTPNETREIRAPGLDSFCLEVEGRGFEVDAFVTVRGRAIDVEIEQIDEVWSDGTGADRTDSATAGLRSKITTAVRREVRRDLEEGL